MLDFVFDKRNKKAYTSSRFILALSISILFILAVYCTCGMWFETNDDVFLSELMSGKITGNPEFLCTFLNPIVALPISLLYRITTVFPWWGGFLFLVLFISIFTISCCVLFVSEKYSEMLLGLTLLLGNLFLSIYTICQSQFTSASMLMAFCGYIIILCLNQSKLSYTLFFLFEFLACAIRYESMVIVQPVCFLLFISLQYRKNANFADKWIRLFRTMLKYGISIVLILGVILGGSFLTFREEELKEFKDSGYLREYLVDYQSPIPYEQLESILSKYNISERDYVQYMEFRYLYPDTKFTADCFAELLPVLKEIRSEEKRTVSLGEAISQLLFTSDQFWHLHQFTFLLLLGVLALSILLKLWNWLLPISAAFSGYFIGIIVLSLRNRFVLRVMIPYYLGTCILISIVLLLMLKENMVCKEKKRLQALAVCSFLLLYLISTASVGRSFFAYGRLQNNLINRISFQEMNEIKAYCNAHREDSFLLDMDYVKLISTPIFESNYYQRANYCYSGSWLSKTPSINEYTVKYLNKDAFYYLVYEAQEWKGLEGANFYASEYGSELHFTEKFKLSSGATVWVYRIDNNLKESRKG